MQKKLIALAVATAFAPAMAMAEVTVYGQAHLSMDSHSGYTETGASKINGLQLASNSSRLGFKGSIPLDGGMTAVYQYEASIALGTTGGSIIDGTRDSFIGLAGDFGTFLGGRLPLANQYVYDVNFFADQVGDAGNFAVVGNAAGGRVSRAVAYASPAMGPISFLVAFVPNTQESVGVGQAYVDKQSSYTLRGSYKAGGIVAAASYQDIGVAGVGGSAKDSKLTVFSLAATYDYGQGTAGVQYTSNGANAAFTGGASSTQNVISGGATFKLSDSGTVKAQITKASASTGSTDGGTMFAVGYDHALSKSAMAYVAFASVSNDAGASFSASGWGHGGVSGPADQDPKALSVGAVYKF